MAAAIINHPLSEAVSGATGRWLLIEESGYSTDIAAWLREFGRHIETSGQIRSGNIYSMFRHPSAQPAIILDQYCIVDHQNIALGTGSVIQCLGLEKDLLKELRALSHATCPQCGDTLSKFSVKEAAQKILTQFQNEMISIHDGHENLIDEIKATPKNALRLEESITSGFENTGFIYLAAANARKISMSMELRCRSCSFQPEPITLSDFRDSHALRHSFWGQSDLFHSLEKTFKDFLSPIGLAHIDPFAGVQQLTPGEKLQLFLFKSVPAAGTEVCFILDTPSAWLGENALRTTLSWLKERSARIVIIDNSDRYPAWREGIFGRKIDLAWGEDAGAPAHARLVPPLLGAAEKRKTVGELTGVVGEIAEFFASLPVSLIREYSAVDFVKNIRSGIEEVTFKGQNFHKLLRSSVAQAHELLQHIPALGRKLKLLRDLELSALELNLPGEMLRKAEVLSIRLAKIIYQRPKNEVFIADQCQLLSLKVRDKVVEELSGRNCRVYGRSSCFQ